MKPRSARLFKLLQLAVVWILALSAVQSTTLTGLASSVQPVPPVPAPALAGPPAPSLAQPGPVLTLSGLHPRLAASPRAADPPLSCGAVIPESCNSLQVIMIIDDSGSMLYNDPQNTRFQGVENMLDILAKEYYLPAIDANTTPPDIQVAIIHFSSAVMNAPSWKQVNPKNLDDWAVQAKAWQAEITGKLNATQPLFTDFKPALQAAAKLAADKPQSATCPRLVMLFTDGVPNLGAGDLKGTLLTSYMDGLKTVVQPAFPRKNDYLYVTAFESNTSASFWSSLYQQKWQEITSDSPTTNPRHADYVPTLDLAPRMEKILGATIGTLSFIISPDPKDPTHYALDLPAYVGSLRLTYYKLNSNSTLTVTGPDGKVITPDGQKITQSGASTSIEVLTIPNPVPGAYQLKTSAPGGIVSKLILYKPVSAVLTEPTNPLLLFTSGNIQIQLQDSQGQPVPEGGKWLFKFNFTQSGQTEPVSITQLSGTFETSVLPLSIDPISVSACVALVDSSSNDIELFNGPVGTIQIDPITVKVSPPSNQVCVPSGAALTIPLQLINSRTSQPVSLGSFLDWRVNSATTGGQQIANAVTPVNPDAGSFALNLTPVNLDPIQTQIQATAVVDDQAYLFYTGEITTATNMLANQKVSVSLGAPQTTADSFSVQLNRWFHSDLFGNGALVLIGRHLFGWFGPTSVLVSGQIHLSDPQNNTAGISIQDFSAQLVSQGPETSSLPSKAWQTASDGTGQILFPSPGLGLYQVVLTYQGKLPSCATLADLPTQNVLLINDFWEYLFWLLIILLLILFLIWLIPWLLCRFRNRLHGYLGIVDESGRILWKVRLSGDEEMERGRSCYDWEFDDLICEIRRLRIRAWDKRRRWLTLTVWGPAGKSDHERSLDEWRDIEAGECDIAWWPHDPGERIGEGGGRDGDDGGEVVVILPGDPALPGAGPDDKDENEHPGEDDEIILLDELPGDDADDEQDPDVKDFLVEEVILIEDRSENEDDEPGDVGDEEFVAEEVILIEPRGEKESARDDEEIDALGGYAIEAIEGLDPVSAGRLRELGILTASDLLDAADTREDREDLSVRSGISFDLLLHWVNRADLLRVPGIEPEILSLLEACGVSTLRKLSHLNPRNLFNHLGEVNAEKHILSDLPSQEEVEAWVEAAKVLEDRVTD